MLLGTLIEKCGMVFLRFPLLLSSRLVLLASVLLNRGRSWYVRPGRAVGQRSRQSLAFNS
jgi:hypothetical protein